MLGAHHRAATARAASARLPKPGGVGGSAPDRQAAGRAIPSIGCLLLGMAAATAALAASATASGAVEWIVGGSVSQSLEADSNGDLDEDGGPVYGTTTALGLDVLALTPTTQLQFETGASVGLYGGDAEDEDDSRNGIYPNLGVAFSRNGKYVDTGASFAFDMRPTAFSQFEDTGVVEGDATEVSVRLAADAAYALDGRNSLSLGGSGSVTRFTGGTTTLEPTTSYGATLAWGHALSADTQANLAFGASRFTAESIENPDSLSLDLSAGVSHLVNPRLSFDASLGPSVTRTTRTRAGERDTEVSIGAIGGLDIAWAPAPDTQLVFALSHGLEPSSRGELETTTALGIGLQHAVNSWTSAGVDLLVQRQTAGGGFEDEDGGDSGSRILATLSPSLAFSLAPDWALQASYALAVEREDESDAISNRFFLTLTHQFDILP
jgi:hypothetical protein